MKTLRISTLILFLLAFTNVFALMDTCKSSQNGSWAQSNRWTCDAGVANPPDGAWNNGKVIVIRHDISVPNNDNIDLTSSDIELVIIEAGAKISYGSNAKIKLPAGVVVILETGAEVEANNNSQGTLLEIGGNGVWGRGCNDCSNTTLTGPGFIDENSTPGQPLNSGAPLPVSLEFFSASASEHGANTLIWKTASEVNNDFFDLQHSTDAENWQSISKITGSGNSFDSKMYQYIHHNPKSGKNYYRLVQVDFDGTKSTHSIAFVFNDNLDFSKIELFPNPTSGKEFTLINNHEFQIDIALVSPNGRFLKVLSLFPFERKQVSMKEFSSGLYFLKTTNTSIPAVIKLILD